VRRNVIAAVVQLSGIAAIVLGAAAYAWQLAVVAVGVVVLLFGLDLEGDG
jgi:hypothetical protein